MLDFILMQMSKGDMLLVKDRGIIFVGDFLCTANSVIFSSQMSDNESEAKQIC